MSSSNIIPLNPWTISAIDLEQIQKFCVLSRWEPTFEILYADDGIPYVVFEYPDETLTFQIGPDKATNEWVMFGSECREITRGRTISQALTNLANRRYVA